MYEVTVKATWETIHDFEFDNYEDAKEFSKIVNGRDGDEALDAIIEQGDIQADSYSAELVDWSAGTVRERR